MNDAVLRSRDINWWALPSGRVDRWKREGLDFNRYKEVCPVSWMASNARSSYNIGTAKVGVAVKVSSIKSFGTQVMKLLLLTAFMLPSLVPAGFMAQRNADTGQLEIALCPSGFSQAAIKALSGPAPAVQSHHAHHQHQHESHFSPLVQPDNQLSGVDHSSHHEDGSAELCPLAGPGAFVGAVAEIVEFTINPVSISYSEQPLAARATALLPPPVRGPPALT